MTFARTDDQRALETGLAAFLAGARSADWDGVIGAFGLGGLGIAEGAGGLGTGIREAAIVAGELGRAGLVLPWAEHWAGLRLSGEPGADAGQVTALAAASNRADWAADVLTILHCAEMAGLCAAMLADTIAFARERRQFGSPIASFQVLRHRMVDMRLAHEQAAAMTGYALDLIDGEAAARGRAVSAARVLAEDAVRIVGGGAVQIHGAMGLTEELRLGRLYRRAATLAQGDGTGRGHLRRYAGAA